MGGAFAIWLKEGDPRPESHRGDELEQAPAMKERDLMQESNPMKCPRCEQELQYVGTKKFHERV